ncbi:MAG TPA: hypothetical protein V6D20_23890 [Candidatus Obscuribacterales bacterium]
MQGLVSKIRTVARECADEAIKQLASDQPIELSEPLPGDWEAYREIFDGQDVDEAFIERGAHAFEREYEGRIGLYKMGIIEPLKES